MTKIISIIIFALSTMIIAACKEGDGFIIRVFNAQTGEERFQNYTIDDKIPMHFGFYIDYDYM